MDIKRRIDKLLEARHKKAIDMIQFIEMTETGYYSMVKNPERVKLKTLIRIAEFLDVQVNDLISADPGGGLKVEERAAIYKKSKSHITLEFGVNDIVTIDMGKRTLDICKGGK